MFGSALWIVFLLRSSMSPFFSGMARAVSLASSTPGICTPCAPGQWVITSPVWLPGNTCRHPFSSSVSISGNQTVSISVWSASSVTTPRSWCQGVAPYSVPTMDWTISNKSGLTKALKTAGPAQKGVSLVIPFCGSEKSKNWLCICLLSS